MISRKILLLDERNRNISNLVIEKSQPDHNSSLRFAALFDSDALENWQAAALDLVLREGQSSLVAVAHPGDPRVAEDTLTSRLPKLFRPFERESHGSVRDFLSANSISAPIVHRDDLGALRLDFILYLGYGAVEPAVATGTKHGVWLFRFGRPEVGTSYPPGVWEIIAGDTLTQGALCQLTRHGDMRVLRDGTFDTVAHVPHANANRLLGEAARWPAYVSRLIARGLQIVAGRPVPQVASALARIPGPIDQLRFASALAFHKVLRLPNLFFDDSWNVAIVDQPIQDFLKKPEGFKALWFPLVDASRYLADPMGGTIRGATVVLCESYDFGTDLGSIVRLGSDGECWQDTISPVIPSHLHSSYPYLLESDDTLFCVPESNQANEIVLYEAEPDASNFVRIRSLIAGGRYLDPTVFRYDGVWWLFCTDADLGEHSHLIAFHADHLAGDWTPHILNPLKIDVRSSRPAGTPFIHDGKLYRPSQNCSATYGGAVTINEVTRLTPTAFAEEIAVSVPPLRGSRYSSGLHTLSRFGNRTLIDGKRRIFTGKGLQERVAAFMRRART